MRKRIDMGKFVIKNILIEKSLKDIQTGRYRFGNNFNLICGDNEAGKSSLMKFIRNGFFKTTKIRTEKGKIEFEYKNSSYNAEISDNTKPPVIFDEYNQKCDETLLNNAFNEHCFYEGFTINLDDLSISEKESLSFIEELKDPSNSLLKSYAEKLENEFYSNVSRKTERLNPTITNKMKEIREIENKIKENSYAEESYIELLKEKEAVELKIKNIENEIIYLNSLNYLKNVENETKTNIQTGLTFNVNAEIFKDDTVTLKERIKTYNQNLKSIENNSKSLIEKQKGLSEYERKLIELTGTIAVEEEFYDFPVNGTSNKDILTAEDELNYLRNESEKSKAGISVLEEDISRQKTKIKNIKTQNRTSDIPLPQLKELSGCLEYGINEISDYDNKINSVRAKNEREKETNKINSVFTISAIFIFIISIMEFVKADLILGFILLIIAGYLFGTNFINKKPNIKENETEIKNLEEKLSVSYDFLKKKLSTYYPNIKDCEVNNLLSEIKIQKRAIDEEIKITSDLNEIVKEQEEKENKLNNIKNELKELQKQISEKENHIKTLVYPPLFNKTNSIKCYVEAAGILNLIEQCKNEILNIDKTIKEQQKENDNILNFIILKTQEKQTEINSMHTEETKTTEEAISEKENLISERDKITKKTGEYSNVEYNVVLKNRKNELSEKYKNIIKSICTKKLATEIIKTAKNKFNKEQPNVVSAEKYLSLLTGGKYSKIDLDGNKISNAEENNFKEWEILSRGTREQLYLALRLGYASNYSKDKNTNENNGKPDLPIIIDDAFVNFDEKRTKHALKCLLEFSKTNQVLFFTCHGNEIKNLINELNPTEEINIINI